MTQMCLKNKPAPASQSFKMMSDFCISTARLASLVIEKNIDPIERFFKSLVAATFENG